MTVVVDTNVILVANGQHADVRERCVSLCQVQLSGIMQNGCIAIDDGHRILTEYRRKTSPNRGKRAGDTFLKWLLRNNANPARCAQLKLKEHAERGFESFPDDPRLLGFDRSDRKFVAVAAAHPDKPPILQAADSKWLDWREALLDHGMRIEFLCPDDIAAFARNKKKKKRKR